MANRCYLSIWTSGYDEDVMLDRFERFLETVPLSAKRPGFSNLAIRAISAAETPLLDADARAATGPADLVALMREHRNRDSAYEVEAYWDLWQRDSASGLWQREPQRLLLMANGEDFDDGVAAEVGHFTAEIGLEYLYTGHGGLLGTRGPSNADEEAAEDEFLSQMTREEYISEYFAKTRENAQQLLTWLRAVEHALPVERYRLWSEGEENLEARLDEVLAVR
jgi:hypothetical protein